MQSAVLRHGLLAVTAASAMFVSGCWVFAPTGLDGVVEAEAHAQCHFAFACCTPPERAAFQGNAEQFRDEGTCVSETLDNGSNQNNIVARAKAVLAASKGEFDQQRADECIKPLLDALNNCDAVTVLGGKSFADGLCDFDIARGFVKGNVKDGGACNDDIECADFGQCDRSGNDATTVTTAGKCKTAKKLGDTCFDANTGDNFACVPGTQCEFGRSNKCAAITQLGNGESCNFAGECKSGFCADGAVKACRLDTSPCAVDSDCQQIPGNTCDSTTAQVCTADGPTVEVCDGT